MKLEGRRQGAALGESVDSRRGSCSQPSFMRGSWREREETRDETEEKKEEWRRGGREGQPRIANVNQSNSPIAIENCGGLEKTGEDWGRGASGSQSQQSQNDLKSK